MTNETLQVRDFLLSAKQELPDRPTMPNLQTRILWAKLLLEETLETIHEGLGLDCRIPPVLGQHLSDFAKSLERDENWVESHPGDLVKLADGCSDTKVVAAGIELVSGIDGEPVMQEVCRSNASKTVDGLFREDGKIMKGPSYSPADILSIVTDQLRRAQERDRLAENPMTNNEYRSTQLAVARLSEVAVQLPLEEFMEAISEAQTRGPFQDPTLYMRAAPALGRVQQLAEILLSLKKLRMEHTAEFRPEVNESNAMAARAFLEMIAR